MMTLSIILLYIAISLIFFTNTVIYDLYACGCFINFYALVVGVLCDWRALDVMFEVPFFMLHCQ